MKIEKQTKLTIIYIFFLSITVLSIIPIFMFFLGYEWVWKVYAWVYFSSVLIYVWYRFILLAYGDFKGKIWGANFYDPFTVIIPCYNEDPVLLGRCIESVEKAKGNKKIIIIDDGSKNDTLTVIREFVKKYDNIKAYAFTENKGKRRALYETIKRTDSKFIITIDSDTVIEKNAFAYLIAPFVEKKVGATTGNIKLINEKENILTRVIAGLYLSGLDNYKKAQSVNGNVVCCSGCLSAYRSDILKEIVDDFLNQMFLNKIAAHSEDRHLTNLVLERGYKVVYVEDAICYTETPSTLKQFLKQQLRWKRGYVRESIYLLSFSWKTSKTLFIEATLGGAVPYFLSFGIQLFIIAMIFISPSYVIFYMIPGWVIFLTIREMPIFLSDPKRAVWFYFYIPLYESLLWWQNIWAIFTVNNKSWGTR